MLHRRSSGKTWKSWNWLSAALSCCPTGIRRISADPLSELKSHVSPPSQFMLKKPLVPGGPAHSALGFLTGVSADSMNI